MPTVNYYSWLENPVGAEQLEVKALCLDEEIDSRLVTWTNREKPFYLFLLLHGEAQCVLPGTTEAVDASDSLIIYSPLTTRIYGDRSRPWRHSWMIANGEIIRHAIQHNNLPLDRPVKFKDRNIFSHYVKMLYAESRAFKQPDIFILGGLMKLFLYEIARSLQHEIPAIPQNISKVCCCMEDHLDRAFGVEEMAQMAALSVSGFIALFKQYYGKPPMRYLNDLRMNMAGQLLQRQYLSIKEVAAAVGFNDQLYFSRKFREYYHCSPSEYKNSLAEN